MKKMKARTKWLVPILALLLILSGCQAIGGFDVNKALLGDLDVKSSESSTTMSLSAVPAAGITAEDREVVDLINSLSLTLGHVKVQDNGNVSATGVVGYKELKIPFSSSRTRRTWSSPQKARSSRSTCRFRAMKCCLAWKQPILPRPWNSLSWPPSL